MTVVYKRGAWDPFHIGHLNVIQTAANLGDVLVVGVATDDWIRDYKHREPFYAFHDRIRILSELCSVDIVVPYTDSSNMDPIDLFGVDIMVIDQVFGKGDSVLAEDQRKMIELLLKRDVRLVRVPRTPGISSSQIRGATNV